MGLQKISLRMYLPHLLENKKTLEFLTSTYEELGNPTILYLWYDKKKDSVEPKELKEFITNWEPDNLVEGIKKFKEIVDFCTQNKTVKKQKRTD